ncbi:MAG: hypothetical protein G01um101448_3 [Parcubacteria group bacterium Gr01-1014_48]|nr:MAG: hypothetical protein Greene041614_365 [Parcubacteria group bacterium Greene0416_14]TSC74588.1 MAG: hypothetical protein G01um101448_3 [Parcubacteria group bacterium Gr01-1014_48]TSD01613.1 MAG: hypothetical protein Greene101415_193 [Parcubacteria group bacterium Greene1014_15]TSD07138.1 MAG: hypothetical protein Greene07144_1006 [Parcubacteria group bacterium Greene0714_4]
MVIAIIGILAGGVYVSLNSGRIKARNAKRASDISQLVLAFNAYAQLNGNFPITGDDEWYCISKTCGEKWATKSRNAVVDSAIAQFVQLATDRQSSTGYSGYLYNSDWDGGNSPFDDTDFPPGIYLKFVFEVVSATPTTCSPGKVWEVTSKYIKCRMKLN